MSASNNFLGFYLTLREVRDELNFLICQYYKQLCEVGKVLKSDFTFMDGIKVTFTKELMTVKESPLPNPNIRDMRTLEFYIFQGDYIKAMEEGGILYRILTSCIQYAGQSSKPLDDQYFKYCAAKRTSPMLRAFYWYLNENYVTKLPSDFQIAFNVDCLLYGEWRCNHPNLIGLHMLLLAWLLGVPEFARFVPEGMRDSSVIAKPPFHKLREAYRVKLDLKGMPKVKDKQDNPDKLREKKRPSTAK